jgi:hypothetical protein
LLAKGWASMDEKANLIELAKTQSALDDVRKANPSTNLSDVIHSGDHKGYDKIAKITLDKAIDDSQMYLGKPSWEQFTKDEMLKVLKKVINELRNVFMNDSDKLPKKQDGTLGFIPGRKIDNV